MPFSLPPLPFAYDALEPHMSARTLRAHHDRHHAAYVKKLNEAQAKRTLAYETLEQAILASVDKPELKDIYQNAAQAWNHAFFWHCLKPGGGGEPVGEARDQILRTFRSFNDFCEKFVAAGMGQFGTGWAWLVKTESGLEIVATEDADLPLINGQTALLTCDVWEHAYYLDYEDKREAFLSAFLKELVDWSFVNECLGRAQIGAQYSLRMQDARPAASDAAAP